MGELVKLTGDEVRFRHDIVRKAAYEGLSVRRRREVHRRACAVIEAWGLGPVADPFGARLPRHRRRAARLVMRWNRLAADAVATRGAMEVAEQLLRTWRPRRPRRAHRHAERRATSAARRGGRTSGTSRRSLSKPRGLAQKLVTADERARIVVDRGPGPSRSSVGTALRCS